MAERPAGTVIFLFTDIEASTRHWDERPELMRRAFARQETIIRESMAAHGGYVYKMVGDSFQVAFADAPSAVAAAAEAQRALRAEPWGELGDLQVRMALHTGVTEERGDDYVGPDLNRLARLVTAGHGGQILLSASVFELLCDKLADGVSLRDLGVHRLKDLVRAEHIYQLVAADLPSDFPPLKTLDRNCHNLPVQLTSFIGREKEIEMVRHFVRTTRLVTLTGAGGSGKTRLALQTAANVLGDFKDGVWFVELAPLTNPALIPSSVASVLGIREQQGAVILDLLTDYLCTKKLLLILDNSEHLIEACAQFANVILQSAANVHLLATSREALGIAGEQIYYVPSLQLPDPREPVVVETIAQMEAVRLFVERAQAVQPRFALTSANAASVTQICQRLDGIPLAIELAASRVQALSVENIGQRLDDAFRLLTGGSRTALPRHQTLRALVTWSYNLLSPQERLLLHRLSVFVGGWTLGAAEVICAGEGIAKEEVLELLTHLVAKSLVVPDEQDGQARYRFLETIRLYAHEKLYESGEGQALRYRHLEYFTNWAEAVEPKLRGAEQFVYQKQLEVEHDNLRAALDWSAEQNVEAGLRLASALAWFWDMSGYWKEGLERLRNLLSQPEATEKTLVCANALFSAGLIANSLGEYKVSREYLERAIAIAREQGQGGRRLLALALCMLSTRVLDQQSPLAQPLYDEGWVIAQEVADQWLIARMLYERGTWLTGRRDYETARATFEKSVSLFRSLGDRRWESFASYYIARVDYSRRDFAAARVEVEQGLSSCYETRDRLGIWSRLNLLGEIARSEGNYALAKEFHFRGYAMAQEMGRKSSIDISAGNLGAVVLREGNLARARELFAESLRLSNEMEQGLLYPLRGFASVAAVQKQMTRAARLFAAADSLQTEGDLIKMNPADEADYDHYLNLIRAQLDQASFNAAWEEGRAMTVEQAVAYALDYIEAVGTKR